MLMKDNLKKTAHIVYPFDLSKNINPWSIGNNIYKALKNNFNIKLYNWTSLAKINPNSGDILIGHAHSNPYTIFRRSLKSKKWKKKILIQPYNEDPLQISYLYDVVPQCDFFLAICGKYWFKRLPTSNFKSWKKKMFQLDLGLDRNQYPFIKKKFNSKNKRKFIYIGNDYAYNNFAKNINFLKKICDKVGKSQFSTVGNKSLEGVKHFGWLNFQNKKSIKIIKNYDFLIQTSKFDANPTVVLESMSWGLIPVITKECGYPNIKSIMNISLNDFPKTVKTINRLQKIDTKILLKYQKKNNAYLKREHEWSIFRKKIKNIVLKKSTTSPIKYTPNEIKFFNKSILKSPNYFLNYDMLYLVLKSNIKILLNFFLK